MANSNYNSIQQVAVSMKCKFHPTKKRFRTREDADLEAWFIGKGFNVYRCRCGGYHFTSRGRCQ